MDLIAKFGLPNERMETPDGTVFQYVECDGGAIIPGYGMLYNTGPSCDKRLFLVKDRVVVRDFRHDKRKAGW